MTRKMPFELQIRKIAEWLVNIGLDPDDYDLSQQLDRSLHYDEQKTEFIRRMKITEEQPDPKQTDQDYDDWKAEQDEKEQDFKPAEPGKPKIFCYRDSLNINPDNYPDDDQELDNEEQSEYKKSKHRTDQRRLPPGFGVTLYFIVEPTAQRPAAPAPGTISRIFRIISSIAATVKPSKITDVAAGIDQWFSSDSPVIQYVIDCINKGIGKTACYNQRTAAGIKGRKDRMLALHDFLRLETEIQTRQEQEIEIITPRPITEAPDADFMLSIQDFFEEQFEDDDFFGQFLYERSEISTCWFDEIQTTGTDMLLDGDFVFEVGEKKTATIPYFGIYTAENNRLKARAPWMDLARLKTLLHLGK